MLDEQIEITREELYEKVWTIPSTKLCKEFGFSDVALAKLCKKHHIPKPPLGYWARVQNGQTVERTPLPKIQNEWLEKITITKRLLPEDGSDPVAKLGDQAESTLKEVITVPESLDVLHEVAATAFQTLKRLRPSANGLIEPDIECLDIVVSPDVLGRAIRIYSGLLQTIDKLGFSIVIKRTNGNQITRIIVDGEPVQIRFEEQLETRQRELTPKEKKELERRPWARDEFGSYEAPTGRLKFQIISDSRLGYRMKWQDTQTAPLEKSLNAFVSGILRAAQAEKAERLEREERERKWAEQQRLEKERKNKSDDLKRRIFDLAEKTEEWKKSKELNDYLDALESSWIEKYGAIDSKSEFAEWIAWARRYAHSLNPLPHVLETGELYDKERSLPSEYGSYSTHAPSPFPKPWFPGRMWYQR